MCSERIVPRLVQMLQAGFLWNRTHLHDLHFLRANAVSDIVLHCAFGLTCCVLVSFA